MDKIEVRKIVKILIMFLGLLTSRQMNSQVKFSSGEVFQESWPQSQVTYPSLWTRDLGCQAYLLPSCFTSLADGLVLLFLSFAGLLVWL